MAINVHMRELRSDIRLMGLAGYVSYTLDRILQKSSNGKIKFLALRFYLQPVPANNLVATRENDPVRVAPIRSDTLDPDSFGRPTDAIVERFASGSLCIAATRNEELLGFMWIQQGVLRERLVRCLMQAEPCSRVAWDYDFFIQPRYRLGRLFGRLWDAASSSLRDLGVDATVSWIRVENRASEQAHMKLGARRIGWAAFLSFFERQLMVSSFKPFVCYSKPGQDAKLLIDASRAIETIASSPPGAPIR